MQRALIRFVLEPLAKLTNKTSQKFQDRLFIFAGLGIFLYFFLYNMTLIPWRYLYSFVLCCGFLGLMILAGAGHELQPVRFRWSMGLCWFGVGALMLLSGVIHNFNYLPEAMLFLAAYPILYICWGNGDTERLFRLLIRLCRISAVIFLAASFLFAQITLRKYGGIFHNVNNCANYLSLVCVCLAVEIAYCPRFSRRLVLDVLLFGACEAIISYTNSRSGQLSMLFAVAAGSVMFLLTHDRKKNLKFLVRAASCALVSVVMISSLLYVFQLRQYLPLPYYSTASHEFYFNQRWDSVFNPPDPSAPSDPKDPDKPKDPDFFGLDSYEELNDKKNDTTDKTADQFSTGRISIWKAYLKKLTLFGVAEKEPVYIDILYREINTTHVTILEIAYESGIFAGILYFCVNILSGLLAIAYAWKHRREKYALMPLMVILTFGIDSVLRTTNISFNYMTTFYYYLILFPLITKDKDCKVPVPVSGEESERS